MRRATYTLLAVMIPAAVSSQTPARTALEPSTTGHTMVRAAGMPLQDGALPPGMVTVRVVRGAFTADLPGQMVLLDIAGGRTETARTGQDGRAQFAHVPIGAQVRVSASIGIQQLTSDAFTIPAASGTRVLLVADDNGTAPPAAPAKQFADTTGSVAQGAGAWNPPTAQRSPSGGVLAVRVFFTVATLAAFAFVLFRQSAPRRGR